MDVRQIHREVQNDLRRYEAELVVLQQKVGGLQKIMDGLLELDPAIGAGMPAATIATNSQTAGSSVQATISVGTPEFIPGNETRSQVLSVLVAANAFLSTQEIAEAMTAADQLPDNKQAVVALGKVISRMSSTGALARRPRDGRSFIYGLPEWAVQNAESPAATGLSVVPAPTSDEGRTADVEGLGDRDDHLSRWNDSDGRGAPSVMEG